MEQLEKESKNDFVDNSSKRMKLIMLDGNDRARRAKNAEDWTEGQVLAMNMLKRKLVEIHMRDEETQGKKKKGRLTAKGLDKPSSYSVQTEEPGHRPQPC